MSSLISNSLFIATTVAEWSADSTSEGREGINDADPGYEDDENKHNLRRTNGNNLNIVCFH